jgi:hypothetical protein
MARIPNIIKNKKQICAVFEAQHKRIFRKKDILQLMHDYWPAWELPNNMTFRKFINFFLKEKLIYEHSFDFPHRKEVRYAWGIISIYQILVEIKQHSYFSHLSALYLHNLTEQIPKNIYVNFEQPKKYISPNARKLEQPSIHRAFQRPMRRTTNFVEYGSVTITVLNGMNTGYLGITELETADHGVIRISDLERTLIDCAVRPDYAGGVYSVAEAFSQAAGQISVTRLAAYLKQLDYIYPYHQAIGFYLEKTGKYKPELIEIFQKLPMEHDFYLAHAMKDVEFVERWRLFVPKGMA